LVRKRPVNVDDGGCYFLIIKYFIPLAEFQVYGNFYAVLFNFRCAVFLFYQTPSRWNRYNASSMSHINTFHINIPTILGE